MRIHWTTLLVPLALAGMLAQASGAEQLYVRNKPFKAAVTRQAGALWVDVKALAEALGSKLADNGQGGWKIVAADGTETALETQEVNGVVMAPLDATAALMGARVIVNKDLGTVDVSLARKAEGGSAAAGSKPGAATPTGPLPPVSLNAKSPGSAVNIPAALVPGRINIVEFGAEW